jgi:MFS transporter, PHS family, inorganic phosphate transporter
VATPVGNVFGQVVFGLLADILGRKRMCKILSLHLLQFIFLTRFLDGIELMIMIIATFGQAISGGGGVVSIIGALVCWRFIVSPSSFRAYLTSNIISDGYWYWRRLPSECRHFLRIRFHEDPWTYDGCCVRRTGLGELQ